MRSENQIKPRSRFLIVLLYIRVVVFFFLLFISDLLRWPYVASRHVLIVDVTETNVMLAQSALGRMYDTANL